MNSEINYDQDVSIDQDALDIEWLDQPKLMMKYTKHEADCKRDLQKAKTDLDLIEADLDKEIRNDPDSFGLSKITETAISNAVKSHAKYKKAQKAVHKCQYKVDIAIAAVRSIYGKKEALENLVRLHAQQYFAGPRTPRNLTKEWEQKQKQIRSNKKIKIKRRRKK